MKSMLSVVRLSFYTPHNLLHFTSPLYEPVTIPNSLIQNEKTASGFSLVKAKHRDLAK